MKAKILTLAGNRQVRTSGEKVSLVAAANLLWPPGAVTGLVQQTLRRRALPSQNRKPNVYYKLTENHHEKIQTCAMNRI